MPKCPGCGFPYNVPIGPCAQCGRDLTLPPNEAELRGSEEARQRDDAPRRANLCPKCDYGNKDGAEACERCGHDLAEPFRISVEQYKAAYFDGNCVSCRSRYRWWLGLTWRNCGRCGAPHCRSCWKLTFSERAGWNTAVSRWLCLYCRDWNREKHAISSGGG